MIGGDPRAIQPLSASEEEIWRAAIRPGPAPTLEAPLSGIDAERQTWIDRVQRLFATLDRDRHGYMLRERATAAMLRGELNDVHVGCVRAVVEALEAR